MNPIPRLPTPKWAPSLIAILLVLGLWILLPFTIRVSGTPAPDWHDAHPVPDYNPPEIEDLPPPTPPVEDELDKPKLDDPPPPPPRLDMLFVPITGTGIPVPADWGNPRIDTPDVVFEPGDVDTPPNVIHRVMPRVTRDMVRTHREIEINLRVRVSALGTVVVARPMSYQNPDLTNLAIAAVRQWRFEPALIDGYPVDVWVIVPFRFTNQ